MRSKADKRPMLADLRESGALEQDATAKIRLAFLEHLTRFADLGGG